MMSKNDELYRVNILVKTWQMCFNKADIKI